MADPPIEGGREDPPIEGGREDPPIEGGREDPPIEGGREDPPIGKHYCMMHISGCERHTPSSLSAQSTHFCNIM